MRIMLFGILLGSSLLITLGCGGTNEAVVQDIPPMTAEELAAEGEGEEGKE